MNNENAENVNINENKKEDVEEKKSVDGFGGMQDGGEEEEEKNDNDPLGMVQDNKEEETVKKDDENKTNEEKEEA